MKFLVIFLALIGFVSFSIIVDDAYGLVILLSPEESLEQSQTIFVGNITSLNVLEFEKSSTYYTEEDGIKKQVIENYTLSLDEYTVSVEEFVKNPQNSTTLTVRQPTTSIPGQIIRYGGFELGDRVLFYIQNLDGVNEYSFESFKIPKKCDANSVVLQSRLVGTDFNMLQNGIKKQDNFTANLPITFVFESDTRTLYGQNFDVEIFVSKQEDKTFSNRVFHEKISAGSKLCDWIGIAKFEFTLDSGKYLLNGNISDDDSRFSFNNQFLVVPQSPLKQIKNGVALIDVTCSEGKVPSYKGDRMRVACVSEETQSELWTRGWATMRLISPGENISHALCNNYEGKWHPEHDGCRDIGDLQCSLMGGKFVDGLKICYNEICPVDKTYTLCVTNPEPEPEPNPIPEEYDDKPVTKQNNYISPFDEKLIQEFQEYHTVITGKVIEWYGQKQPSKYYYQYRVEALAHHTPRMQEDSIYKILGDEDNFIPVNADVVLFGLDKDDEGSLYIVKTVILEKPSP